ncbi:MAG TPA: hypothetical protein VGS97_06315 [Actinocrinis sp.]|uniref:hypothetical protein n=1 Tax=Actinocrinis sp. TaxID=1920516 RepID=UPI002DDD2EB8|nr:hypothetical protein [Actinocrinis sp.]HEV2343685.1 hypothetical protein [Actinocrinis sp.]
MTTPTGDSAPSLKPGRYTLEYRYGVICIMCNDCDEEPTVVGHLTRHIDDDHAATVWEHEKVHDA